MLILKGIIMTILFFTMLSFYNALINLSFNGINLLRVIAFSLIFGGLSILFRLLDWN